MLSASSFDKLPSHTNPSSTNLHSGLLRSTASSYQPRRFPALSLNHCSPPQLNCTHERMQLRPPKLVMIGLVGAGRSRQGLISPDAGTLSPFQVVESSPEQNYTAFSLTMPLSRPPAAESMAITASHSSSRDQRLWANWHANASNAEDMPLFTT